MFYDMNKYSSNKNIVTENVYNATTYYIIRNKYLEHWLYMGPPKTLDKKNFFLSNLKRWIYKKKFHSGVKYPNQNFYQVRNCGAFDWIYGQGFCSWDNIFLKIPNPSYSRRLPPRSSVVLQRLHPKTTDFFQKIFFSFFC